VPEDLREKKLGVSMLMAVERNANVAIDARCVAVVPLFVNVVVVVVNVERNKVD